MDERAPLPDEELAYLERIVEMGGLLFPPKSVLSLVCEVRRLRAEVSLLEAMRDEEHDAPHLVEIRAGRAFVNGVEIAAGMDALDAQTVLSIMRAESASTDTGEESAP